MKTHSIADAKNNLSTLIHQLDEEKSIHLTRYGKPVAVMMSEAQYKKLTSPGNNLFSAIQDWRNQIDGERDTGFNQKDLDLIRKESAGCESSWDK